MSYGLIEGKTNALQLLRQEANPAIDVFTVSFVIICHRKMTVQFLSSVNGAECVKQMCIFAAAFLYGYPFFYYVCAVLKRQAVGIKRHGPVASPETHTVPALRYYPPQLPDPFSPHRADGQCALQPLTALFPFHCAARLQRQINRTEQKFLPRRPNRRWDTTDRNQAVGRRYFRQPE